jgi:hypothetical protein
MIARINFGLGTPAPRPQAPIGNPIGHAVAQTLPRPAVHNLVVRTPYTV